MAHFFVHLILRQGAYYYYFASGPPKKLGPGVPQKKLAELDDYFKDNHLPVSYYQLDAWWCKELDACPGGTLVVRYPTRPS